MRPSVAWLLRLLISAGLGWISWLFFKSYLLGPQDKRSFLWELDYIPFPFVAALIWLFLISAVTISGDRDEPGD